jgi:hypothetical protein
LPGKFTASVIVIGVNLPPVSFTPVENMPPSTSINDTSGTGGKFNTNLPPVTGIIDIGAVVHLDLRIFEKNSE